MKIEWLGDEEYAVLDGSGERDLCLAEIMCVTHGFSVWVLGKKVSAYYATMSGAKRAAIRELRKIHAAIGRHVVGYGK